MLVTGINNYTYTHKIAPYYKTKQTNPIQVNFTGIDRFEKSASSSFYNGIMTFYNKLEQEMGILKPKDIEKIVSNVVKRTDIAPKTVYNAMGMLTQYSSYKSLGKIENGLHEKGYYNIESLPVKRDLFIWRNPCLADALGYVGKRNFNHSYQKSNAALIVDSEMLKWLDFIQIHPKKFFKDKNPLYIENFENGYNFFNQSKSLEDFTVEKLKKAKHLQAKYGKSILHNLKYILNGNVLGRLQKQGVDIQVLKADVIKNPTAEQIAQNVNPIMPDFQTFYYSVKNIPKIGDVPKEIGEKYVLQYLNDMTCIVTPRKYGEYLKEIHSKIIDILNKKHRDISNLYCVVPNPDKSFSVTNYMYRQANNTQNIKNLFVKTSETFGIMHPGIDVIPNNSTIVIMDDYMISGLSMLKEQFPYDELVETFSTDIRKNILQEKNINIIFAPIISTKSGKTEFEHFIQRSGRANNDKIIFAKQLPQYEEKIIFNNHRKYNRFQTSTILPYMGPDTNTEEFVPMYEKFLYNPYAQKPVAENIGDAYEFIM